MCPLNALNLHARDTFAHKVLLKMTNMINSGNERHMSHEPHDKNKLQTRKPETISIDSRTIKQWKYFGHSWTIKALNCPKKWFAYLRYQFLMDRNNQIGLQFPRLICGLLSPQYDMRTISPCQTVNNFDYLRYKFLPQTMYKP